MKNIQILVLFFIGATLTGLGVLFKYLEYTASDFFLIIGMTFNGFAAILLILKLFKKDKPGSFLDS